jgi:transposase InsO family protein
MKYAVIRANIGAYSVRLMCRVLMVSHGGYYEWARRKPSKRQRDDERLTSDIKRVFEKNHRRTGSIRVAKLLQHAGQRVSRNRVARLMRSSGLRARASKKFKATTNSNHKLPVAPNLLEQDFSALRPNTKWVSDITYIWTEEGWLYLAAVLDLYSRMLIGWAMSERMTSDLVVEALQMALWNRKMPRDVIVHSDRGSQYCSGHYQSLLAHHHLVCSMSKRGDCYDNAAMESWNHSFKVEAIHNEKFKSREDAKKQVFDYIEVYYNRSRLHSTLGYLSPTRFEELNAA